MGWQEVADKLDGLATVKHAVLTYSGTWSPPGFGFQSDVVNGVIQFVSEDLLEEVEVPYPSSFGPLTGGGITAPSYQQSLDAAVQWTGNWLSENPRRTIALGGYSQGAEAAARVAHEIMNGSLVEYKENLIGGYAFGTPGRMQGHGAPGVPTPPGRGISSFNMTQADILIINGQDCWADYNNPGDMYGTCPGILPNGVPSQVGLDMTDIYTLATQLQLNDMVTFAKDMVTDMLKMINDLGGIKALLGNSVLPTGLGALEGDLLGLLGTLGPPALLGLLTQLITPGTEYASTATGVQAATIAAAVGLQFIAQTPACAPHGGYEGAFGFPNYVANAVGHLTNIATLTPARA